MARKRSFAIDEVTAQAMAVFWRRGFAATSMSDIYAATGLKPGSVYGAFKDKDDLFRHCFEAYAAHFRSTLPTGVAGFEAIDAWLKLQAELAADDPDRKGCLIINTMTEREVHAPATQALANGRIQEIRDFFRRNLDLGFPDRPNGVKDLQADALLGAVVAIMALGRAGADRSVIDHVALSAAAQFRAPD